MSAIVTAVLLALAGVAICGATVHVLGRSKRVKAAGAIGERSARESFGFRLGVGAVISVRRTEVWLERGWLLREQDEAVALVLFSAEKTIIALPEPRAALFWLDPIGLDWPAEPPPSLEVEGLCYERARRVPVDIIPLEKTPDPPWRNALLTEYRSPTGEVIWSLGGSSGVKAWSGRRVEESELEVWG